MKHKLTNIQKQITSYVQEAQQTDLDTLDMELDNYERRIIASSLKALGKKGILRYDGAGYRIPDNVTIDGDVAIITKNTETTLTPQEETVIREAVELPSDESALPPESDFIDYQSPVGVVYNIEPTEYVSNNDYDTDYENLKARVNQEIYGFNIPESHPHENKYRGVRQADLSTPEGILRDILQKYHVNEEFIESMVDVSRYSEMSPYELGSYLRTMEVRGKLPLKAGEAQFIGQLIHKGTQRT